jgi:Methyltransferase domain
MPHWLIKSATHRVISWLPNPQSWNYPLQKYVTKTAAISKGGFEFKLERGRRMIEEYQAHAPRPREAFTVLELGTGWYPIIPIAMYLSGAAKVWTVDVVSLLRPEQLRALLQLFSNAADQGELFRILPCARSERLAKLRELLQDKTTRAPRQILAEINIESFVMDARHTSIAPGSIDLIFSESVLIHVPENVTPGIFQEFRRVAAPNAVMVHSIILSDHYARFDPRITDFNLLKYSRGAWRFLNSPVEYQSRFRITDYRRMHESAGFRIVRENSTRGSKTDLESVRLDADFCTYPMDDLLVTYAWVVSVPQGVTG